jgi:hypothetical protein
MIIESAERAEIHRCDTDTNRAEMVVDVATPGMAMATATADTTVATTEDTTADRRRGGLVATGVEVIFRRPGITTIEVDSLTARL